MDNDAATTDKQYDVWVFAGTAEYKNSHGSDWSDVFLTRDEAMEAAKGDWGDEEYILGAGTWLAVLATTWNVQVGLGEEHSCNSDFFNVSEKAEAQLDEFLLEWSEKHLSQSLYTITNISTINGK